MVIKNFSDEVMFISTGLSQVKKRKGKSVAGRENNMCKGPEVGRSLSSQNNKFFLFQGLQNAFPSAWTSFIYHMSWVPTRHSARF